MSWYAVGAAAVSVVGGAISSNKASKAAGKQQRGVDAGIASEERMFERSLELQQPYREAGYDALGGLNQLVDPAGRTELLDQYYGGSEYATQAGQVEEQQLRNAAVTGGLRGGGNQAALATIAPQLGQQYLSNRYQQLSGIANMGMGAASQGAGSAMQLGGNISALQQQAAQAGAANSLAQANIWGNVVSDVGGFAMDYYNKPSTGYQQ